MRNFVPLFLLSLGATAIAPVSAQELISPMQDAYAASAEEPSATSSDDFATRLRALESELSQLKKQTADGMPAPAVDENVTFPELAAAEAPKAAPPAPSHPNFKVTGFFQLDWGFYDQDAANIATLGDIDDGLGFRRARLAATGDVAKDISYMMEFDFAQAQARFVDVWMQFTETPIGNLRIGRFRQPFGMSELTSIRELTFLERPTMFTMAPFRQTGAMLFDTAADERMTWAVSGYRYLSDNFGNVYADDGGYGTAMRLTALPIDCGEKGLVHLGADYSFNDPGRDLVQFVSTNEFFVSQNPNLGPNGLDALPIVSVPPFVNTGLIPTQHANFVNLETAASYGRAAVQSEARWVFLEQLNGINNTFPAMYVEGRYMLTGEAIPYNRKAGVFTRIKPNRPCNVLCGDWGAWEMAARVSYIDLNGEDIPGPGRRLTNAILGLNWYVSERARFQFNWIHSALDDPTIGNSDAETFATSAQVDF